MNIHDIYDIDLTKLNSITKYPSIPTYHAIGDKGRLSEEVLVPFDANDEIIVTEKVDGTNARIIVWCDEDEEATTTVTIIGSREELLHARSDLIYNPSQGIVEAVRHVQPSFVGGCRLHVIYGEVYGGKIQAAGKMYSPAGKTGFRIFDAFEMSFDEVEKLLKMSREEIAHWRDGGGQPFMNEMQLGNLAVSVNVELTPRRWSSEGYNWVRFLGQDLTESESMACDLVHFYDKVHLPIPRTIAEAFEWLQQAAPLVTRAAIDGPGGKPEGIVIRTPDRKKIAKLRFEDYERTLRVKR